MVLIAVLKHASRRNAITAVVHRKDPRLPDRFRKKRIILPNLRLGKKDAIILIPGPELPALRPAGHMDTVGQPGRISAKRLGTGVGLYNGRREDPGTGDRVLDACAQRQDHGA